MSEPDEIGIGPHVKCGAFVDVPPMESTRRVYGRQGCVLPPSDGHTVHATTGAVYLWEGPREP